MKIQALRDEVINQIAAGEVIERPLSIVRELLDNSVDSGASTVELNIHAGGQALIAVNDNGCGMDKDDLLMAFERHTTSKIASSADLLSIATYGFRGEALSSIAAVAQVTCRSRTQACVHGTEIILKAGRIAGVQPVAMSSGTQMEVHNLFYNVPARKKFLKSVSNEEKRIKDWLNHFALANPTVEFSLAINGQAKIKLLAASDLFSRALELFGDSGFQVQSQPLPGVKISALLQHPGTAQFDASSLCLIVNGRVISDRMLARAVKDGFGSMLKDREFPVGFLAIDLPADLVDVNVHPQKSEVRFRAGRELFSAIHQSVRKATEQLKVGSFVTNRPAPQLAREAPIFYTPPADYGSSVVTEASQVQFQYLQDHAESSDLPLTTAQDFSYSRLRYIGQLLKCFLLCEYQDSFIVVDMHAAHERVRYEQLRSSFNKGTAQSLQLLLPETVRLSPQAVQRIIEELPTLEKFGFDVDLLGEDTLVLRSIPALLGQINASEFFKELASYDEDAPSQGALDRRLDYIAASAACHSSIRSGRVLSAEQVYHLFQQLDVTPTNNACPHGRPIVRWFSRAELDTWFGRQK